MQNQFTKIVKNIKTYQTLYLVGSAVLLAVAAIFTAWHANLVYSNIQDAVLYPYLFEGFNRFDVIVPADHANFLKFPLFVFQAIIPYNPAALAIVNISLVLITVFGWCLLLAYLFGKKFLPFIFIAMASILFASDVLGLNILETTIRNIEYPLGLAFVILVGKILHGMVWTKATSIVAGIITLLFTITLAGDSFMLYGFVAPMLLVLFVHWFITGKYNKNYLTALGVLIASVVSAFIFRIVVEKLGIVAYASNIHGDSKTVPVDGFGPSLVHALSQIFDLFGANVFYKEISMANSIFYVNFILLLLGAVGLVLIGIRTLKAYTSRKSLHGDNRFVLATLAASFVITLAAYIFSNLVLIRIAQGQYIDASNIRYITLLPFLLLGGLVYLVATTKAPQKRFLGILVGAILVSLVFSISAIQDSRKGWDNFASDNHAKIESIVSELKKNNIHHILSGDSIGAPIRFRSGDSIQYVSITGCGSYSTYNTRLSWRQPLPKTASALVIDRAGLDGPALGKCTNRNYEKIYGKPSKVIEFSAPGHAEKIEIWIYPYDIRTKLQQL